MAAKKKPTAKQLAARKKFAAAAKARSKAAKGKKRNTTIIKAKRIEHLDVSKIHSLGKVENPNYTVEAIPKYTSTVKRDVKALSRGSAIRKVQREVEGPKNVYRYRVEKNPAFAIHKTLKAAKRGNQAGWMLGNKFYAKSRGQKSLPGGSILDLNSGIVYQRVENPKRRKSNITSADLQYAGTAKRATQDGVKGWMLGGKFFPGSATTKAHRLTSSAFLDLRTGDVWKRKAKGNPKRQNIAQGFYDGNGIFHPIRASADYDGGTAGETGGRAKHTRSKKKKAAAKKASQTARDRAAKRAASKTKTRLASRVLHRSVPLKKRRNVAMGFYDGAGVFHPIRASADYDGKAAGETGGKPRHTRSEKRAAAARKASSTARSRAATKARKATTSRLASRALQRSVPLKKARRNPDTPAQKLQEWRGYPKTGEDTLRFPTGTPSGLYKLGVLKKIILSNGTRITPAAGQAWLCADTNGKLHIGGKTNTAAKGRVVDWPKDNLGKVKQVEYEARKPHLGDNERTIYFHKLGEDDGNKPTLHSDGEGGLLFKGGNYSVTSRGLVN